MNPGPNLTSYIAFELHPVQDHADAMEALRHIVGPQPAACLLGDDVALSCRRQGRQMTTLKGESPGGTVNSRQTSQAHAVLLFTLACEQAFVT
jgi:hypothetical protein